MAGQIGDVLPARPGHHLTGRDHTDGGGRHRALLQTDRWYGDARTEMEVLISLDTIQRKVKFISELESIIYMRTRVLFISAEHWKNYKEFAPAQPQPGHNSKQSK